MLTAKKSRLVICLAVVLGLSGMAGAVAEENVSCGINRHYQDPDYESWVSVFEARGREVYDKRHDIVAALHLKPGMAVADVGAGTGLFTRLFAKAVGPTGRVYAVDIAENFVKNILRTGKEQGLSNIIGIVNTQKSTLLPPASVQVVFISDTYHHFEYPQAMLASIHAALQEKGKLAIIDFRKQEGVSSGWVMSHVRANRDRVIREVTMAGFRLTGEPGLLADNYYLVFTKDEAKPVNSK